MVSYFVVRPSDASSTIVCVPVDVIVGDGVALMEVTPVAVCIKLPLKYNFKFAAALDIPLMVT